jgi:hypothetical protein
VDASAATLALLLADCATTRVLTERTGRPELNPVPRAIYGAKVDPVRCAVGSVGVVELVRLVPRKKRAFAYASISVVETTMVVRNTSIIVTLHR